MGDNDEHLYSVQSRKEIRSKRKRKEKMEFSGGREAGGISIHPGPGELVLQGHHPLEVQILPANQARQGIRVNDVNMVLEETELCKSGVDGWGVHERLPLLHRECPLSC